MVTGRIVPSNMLNPSRRIFAPAQVHVGEIESIDIDAAEGRDAQPLRRQRAPSSTTTTLVSRSARRENLEAYPGLAEHAFRLKSFDDCFRLKNHMMEMFELADIEKDAEERRRLLTFFVAGGGFSGSELAGELADFVRLLTKHEYQGIKREECRVVIVHPGPTLLPELYGAKNTERDERGYPKLVEYGMKHSRKLGVELMLETRVDGRDAERGLPLERRAHPDADDRQHGRLEAVADPGRDRAPEGLARPARALTSSCASTAGPSSGPAATARSVPHPNGGTCPPVALFAMKEGQQIGKNLVRSLAGKPLKPFRGSVIGQGVSIGSRTAVGTLKGIPMKGKIGVALVALGRLGLRDSVVGPAASGCSPTGSSGRSSAATSSRWGRPSPPTTTCGITSTSPARRSPSARARCSSST